MQNQGGNASTRTFDPLSTCKCHQLLPPVNDLLAPKMGTSRKQTIEAMGGGEKKVDKHPKENWPFEIKKHEDNRVIHKVCPKGETEDKLEAKLSLFYFWAKMSFAFLTS